MQSNNIKKDDKKIFEEKMKKSKTKIKREYQHLNRLAHQNIIINTQKEAYDEKSDEDAIDKFKDATQKKEAIIELFDLKNIKMKANLSEEQRNALTILMAYYNKAISIGKELGVDINLESIKFICAEFIEMSPSIEGKRAEQFVEANKAAQQQFPPQQFGGYGNYSPQMQQMRK